MKMLNKVDRFNEISSHLKQGRSLADISKILNVNDKTVRSFVTFHRARFVKDGAMPGNVLISDDEKCRKKLGLGIKEREHLRSIGATRKYISQRSNAMKRGIGFKLTLAEWWEIWSASGKWEQRGLGIGKYVMSRFGDKGDYEKENVEIILGSQNNSDSWLPDRKRKRPSKKNLPPVEKGPKGRPNLKLDDKFVAEIKARYVKGSEVHGTVALAREYGVSDSLVWAIVNNKRRQLVQNKDHASGSLVHQCL